MRLRNLILGVFLLFTVTVKADNIDELKANVEAIVNSSRGGIISVQIVGADKYDQLFSYNPSQKMIPASITKLVTAATALEKLGVNYKFKTVVFTDDLDISDGVVNGNLYIKGYGDPDLYSNDIRYLAQSVRDKNIRQVTGNIIYDESFLDNEYYGLADHYSGDTQRNYWPYVSAINLDKNKGNYDPAASAGELFMQDLQSNGLQIDGILVAGVTPQSPTQIGEISHSILDVLTNMNKISDNHSAITVFKVVGAETGGAPGTLSKGTDAVINFLSSMGNDRYSFEILEGSGLTRYNAVTSDLYIRMLKYMYDDTNTFDTFYKTLAIGGRDGTLRNRMANTEAEGNVHAKTGTLNSVSTLSGYCVSRDNELLIFYVAMNGFNNGQKAAAHRTQDAICEAMCRFSRK